MAEASYKVGAQCFLYVDTAMDPDTPVWSDTCIIGDVSVPDLSQSMAEVNLRCSTWNVGLPSKKSGAIEFLLAYKPGNVLFDFLRVAFFDSNIFLCAVMDGEITTSGSQGLVLPSLVENFPINQPLEELVAIDTCRLAGAYLEDAGAQQVEPYWMIVP